MSEAKKAILLWGVSFLVGFYCVFVIQQMWNWFAVPLLHFGEVSYLQMYGLNILFGLVTARDAGENPVDNMRWNRALIVLDACVPSGSREMVTEQLKEENDGQWMNLGTWVLSLALGYSVSLGLGFLIHVWA
ncbi:MAG: hypothetical protein WAK48_02005 [Candidatus Acidiferrum sp.]